MSNALSIETLAALHVNAERAVSEANSAVYNLETALLRAREAQAQAVNVERQIRALLQAEAERARLVK